ncbi:MAG: sugar phosphate isomerase/epimerase [Phycisphaerales bacterium]|nr:sugar phosphate isomerase/epimerase [Phycisphaerales bacterium]
MVTMTCQYSGFAAPHIDPSMTLKCSRRSVLQSLLALLAASAGNRSLGDPSQSTHVALEGSVTAVTNRLSLAQWSLNRMLKAGELLPLDFPAYAQRTFGFVAVEYVSTFYRTLPTDGSWVSELKKRCDDTAVASLLIMCDGEGELGDVDTAARRRAVLAHRRWLDAAAALGCHSIRVNARSTGTPSEQAACCADGLGQLCALAEPMKLNVLVENHGGISCDGEWVAGLMRTVNAKNCGTLPDFGNFLLEDGTMADRYAGVRAMMPFAKALSAKSYDFSDAGEETATDYRRMIDIARAAGYSGWIGVEYEGKKLSEVAGTTATRDLLIKLGCTL